MSRAQQQPRQQRFHNSYYTDHNTAANAYSYYKFLLYGRPLRGIKREGTITCDHRALNVLPDKIYRASRHNVNSSFFSFSKEYYNRHRWIVGREKKKKKKRNKILLNVIFRVRRGRGEKKELSCCLRGSRVFSI